MTLTEKAAYLKGLASGLALDESKPETKLINAMIDLIDDIALTVADLDDELAVVSEQVDLIDEDLATIEDEFEEDYDDEDEDFEYYEIDCPKCGAVVCLDEDFFDNDAPVTCPECGEEFDIEIECDGNCEGCSDCDE